jgi:mRNA interferase MazF
MTRALPQRGEIWLADLDPIRGREQAGKRPVLIISIDRFNQGPSELTVAVPITSKGKGIPWHVRIEPPDGGVKTVSFAMCEMLRSLSRDRLSKRWGEVPPGIMASVDERLRILFDL